MEPMISLLQKTSLFMGMDPPMLGALIRQLNPVQRSYGAGELILLAGTVNRDIGIVLSGEIEAVKQTEDGAQLPITMKGAGGVFGDVMSGASSTSPVSVYARGLTTVLFISYDVMLSPAAGASEAYSQLLRNLIRTISDKYFALNERIDILMLRHVREKVALFLSGQMKRSGSATFRIAYSRSELADYLSCDRSALSRELGRMRDEGILEFYKNSFKLKKML